MLKAISIITFQHTRGQRLLQFFNLLGVVDSQSVQILGATDLELSGARLGLLDSDFCKRKEEL